MARYGDLLKGGPPRLWERMTPMSEEETQAILDEHGFGIPRDYIEFLREIGWGPVGDTTLTVFGGLTEPGEFWPADPPEELGQFLLCGDDGAGARFGFDVAHEWQVIELGPMLDEVVRHACSFEEFLRDLLHQLGVAGSPGENRQ